MLDAGVTEGVQNEGSVGFLVCGPGVSARVTAETIVHHVEREAHLLVINGLSRLGPLLAGNPGDFVLIQRELAFLSALPVCYGQQGPNGVLRPLFAVNARPRGRIIGAVLLHRLRSSGDRDVQPGLSQLKLPYGSVLRLGIAAGSVLADLTLLVSAPLGRAAYLLLLRQDVAQRALAAENVAVGTRNWVDGGTETQHARGKRQKRLA